MNGYVEVKKVPDGIVRLNLEIERVTLNAVSAYAPWVVVK